MRSGGGGRGRCWQPLRSAGAQAPRAPIAAPKCPPRGLKLAGMAKTTSLRCRVLEGKDLPAKDV